MAVFTRRLTDDLTSLVKKIDETVGKNKDKKMKALVVYLTDDPDPAEAKLKATAVKLGLSPGTPLTVFQTSEGPQSYKISTEADVTVLMWNKLKIQANYAFGKEKLSDESIQKVLADAEKLVN